MSLFSGFGGTVMSLVAGMWVLDLTGSSSLAALTGLCVFAPTLLGPLLGALVDRLPRRPLVVWTHLLTAAAVLSLLAVDSAAQVWLIFAVMLGYGVSYVLIDAGESALLPAALPADALGGVNGMRTSAQEGVKLVAPLAGAGLFGWGGGHPTVVLTAVVLTIAAGLYLLLRLAPALPSPDPTTPGTSTPESGRTASGGGDSRPPGQRVGDAVRFLAGLPELRVTVLVGSVTMAMAALTTAATYAVVSDDLHRPPTFLGVLTSAQGAGSILGGLLVGRLLRVRGTRATSVAGALVFALGAALRCVPWWPATVASALVIGIGLPWTVVAAVTAVQTRTPARMLGRVAATANTLLFAPVAIATPVGAAMILLDHRVPLALAVAVCVGAGLAARRLGRADAVPLGPTDAAADAAASGAPPERKPAGPVSV
ncbi:MFS transporter [Plantactinospora sonchi]|uniref:MFS transporter n=1 Tax=Plantactinospora sonchi TaxID=1544735 RepID=A0ABU7RZV6_9ACTN